MGLRFASGPGVLSTLVREDQDLRALRREKDKALIGSLSLPEGQQDPAATDRVRKQISAIDSRRTVIAAQLENQFPDYAALTRPKPLMVEETQKLLGADEALVFFLTDKEQSYVFALTRDGFDWKTIALGADKLSAKVAALRNGLDVNEPALFDLALANEIYSILLAPVEALIKEKRVLLIAPSGALTALPFHLLITEMPAAGRPKRPDDFRDGAWLLRRHAVAVLPSVASLKALRVFSGQSLATKPMIGFGDPVFDPNMNPGKDRRTVTGKVAAKTRAYSEFWHGASVDRDQLARALAPLPDTAVELKAVAATLRAVPNDIILGKDATETLVKRAPLGDYRIVYFATHALVAGDVKGLGEPSLVLSIPWQPTDLDDGLLTASEVAQLKLNADWVVLSACNTIAGEKPGAEALSGLARAFFYGGARAVLASHWAVESQAAVRLTTSTFELLKADPKLGRAEALRRAMLAFLSDKSLPENAYPAFWGPFALIGEGSVR
jgi:CHAT domain-containing protein